MKVFLWSAFILLLSLAAIYLAAPSPGFPLPPPGSLQSDEPADTETVYRRAYYTNLSRAEAIRYYTSQFNHSWIQYLLNYPPEQAYTLIRDQTPSSWLEEIVHPGRESLFVNGFYPTKPTEQININGVHYQNKITVNYVPSSAVGRLTVLLLAALGTIWLKKEYAEV